MVLSEKFNRYSNHYFGIAKDPYVIGASLALAALALPFSTAASALAVAAPIAYACAGAACRAASCGLEMSGR